MCLVLERNCFRANRADLNGYDLFLICQSYLIFVSLRNFPAIDLHLNTIHTIHQFQTTCVSAPLQWTGWSDLAQVIRKRTSLEICFMRIDRYFPVNRARTCFITESCFLDSRRP